MEKEILKYTLKNAIEHKGKADEKAVIGKIFKDNKIHFYGFKKIK